MALLALSLGMLSATHASADVIKDCHRNARGHTVCIERKVHRRPHRDRCVTECRPGLVSEYCRKSCR